MDKFYYDPPSSHGRILFVNNGNFSNNQIPKYKRNLRNSSFSSFILHLIALISLINLYNSKGQREKYDGATSNNEVITKVFVESPKNLDKLVGESVSLPERVFDNFKAKLGPETQDTSPNRKSDSDRLLESIITPNYSLEEKLRNVVSAGKSPTIELYIGANPLGNGDAVDYRTFFLLYLKEYLQLKLNPFLVSRTKVEADKIDLRIQFLITIGEGGQINLLRYEKPPDSKKKELEIFNHLLNQLQHMPNFIPPSKANLKVPYQMDFTFYHSYKTWRELDVPIGRKLFPIVPTDR